MNHLPEEARALMKIRYWGMDEWRSYLAFDEEINAMWAELKGELLAGYRLVELIAAE